MHSFFSHPHLPQFSSGHCLLKLEPVLETCDFVWESMPKKVPVLKAGPPTIDRWTWREEVEHSLCFQAPLGWALPYSPQCDVQICFVYTVMELSNQEFEPWAKVNLPSFLSVPVSFLITATESWITISLQLQTILLSAIIFIPNHPISSIFYNFTWESTPTSLKQTDLSVVQSPLPKDVLFPMTTFSPV